MINYRYMKCNRCHAKGLTRSGNELRCINCNYVDNTPDKHIAKALKKQLARLRAKSKSKAKKRRRNCSCSESSWDDAALIRKLALG